MKKTLVFPAVLMLTFSSIIADDSDQTTFVPPQTDSQCSREVLMSFFPKTIVSDVLTENKIDKKKVDAIVAALEIQGGDVIRRTEEKAAKMNPNPMKDPKFRKKTAKLIRETVTETYTLVLKGNGITDEKLIKDTLDAIQDKKAKLFADCMQKMQPPEAKS